VTSDFLTLAGRADAEIRVRGSRFIATAFPAEEEGSIRGVVDDLRRRFFDATHHCTAWRLRDGSWRAQDDGEPTGSAGAPILAAIDTAGLLDTAVVVTRYFGGTKLGVGGLARAYGDAAVEVLNAAPKRRGVPAWRLRIVYRYDLTSAVMRGLEHFSATGVVHDFAEDGERGRVSFTVPVATLDALDAMLREQTSGEVLAERLAETIVYLPE